MSQQLIYTSAPRGLKPGSRGFCTVATTPGMPANLADRLEALSAYRHIFAPGDARNPVNYSFLSFTLGGRRVYLLSRVADAGLDYTQRTNKIAHHVVLEQNELSPAGPAALLMQPGFMETAWSGEPRTLAPRAIPQVQAPPRKCELWEQLTGDAGWGGYLAEPPEARLGTPVNLVYRSDMPVLALLAEAMALLPPERRWQTTFSTYYTKLPPGIECQWRCVLETSTEAHLVDRQRDAAVMRLVELARNHRRAPAGQHSEAARTGKLPNPLVDVSGPRAVASGVLLKDAELEAELRLADEPIRGASDRLATPAPINDNYRLSPPVAPLPELERTSNYAVHAATNEEMCLRTRLRLNRRSGQWIWITALAALVLVAWAAVFAVSLFNDRNVELAATNAVPVGIGNESPMPAIDSQSDPNDKSTSDNTPTSPRITDSASPPDDHASDDEDAGFKDTPMPPQVVKGNHEKEVVAANGDDDGPLKSSTKGAATIVRGIDRFLKLPNSDAEIVSIPSDLGRTAIERAELKGIVSNELGVQGNHFRLKPNNDESRIDIKLFVSDAADSLVLPQTVASLKLAGPNVGFQWLPTPGRIEVREYLRNCALIGTSDTGPFRLFFRIPVEGEAFTFQSPRDAPYDGKLPKSVSSIAVGWVPPIDTQSPPIQKAQAKPLPDPRKLLVLNLRPSWDKSVTQNPNARQLTRRFLTFFDGIIFKYEVAIKGSGSSAQLTFNSEFAGVRLRKDWREIKNSRSTAEELSDLNVFKIRFADLNSRRSDQRTAAQELEKFVNDRSRKSEDRQKDWEALISDLRRKRSIPDEPVMIDDWKSVVDSLLEEASELDHLANSWPKIDCRIDWQVSIQIGDLGVPLAASKSYYGSVDLK